MLNESNRYWLCCGSRDRNQHRNCTEHLIGHPERRRWGTAEEHKEWADAYLVERGGQSTINT